MRAQVMKRFALVALVAAATTGCSDFAMPSGAMGSLDVYPSNSLVGTSPKGGGGYAGTVAGATSALFQTSLGPVAWKGVQLAQLRSDGPSLLWNAPPDRNNQALTIPQAGLGWAVGYGVARYEDGEWDTETTEVDALSSPTAASDQCVLLTDVSFAPNSATVGYAVGSRGTLLKYDSLTEHWSKVPGSGLTTENLGTVKVLAANDVWVAGKALRHFDGTAWTPYTLPGEVSGLAVVSATEVWASTGNGLYKWDGTAWTAAFTPAGHTVGAPRIAAFGSTIVGLAIEPGVPSGAVFTLKDGAWQTEKVTVPAGVGLDTVVIDSPTTAYAKTYDNAGVYRFDIPTKTWTYYSE